MNKQDFISRLSKALAPLPPEERKAAIDYYEEFFTEAGEENEQSLIAEFGSPEELAKSIIEENNVYNPASNKNNMAADNMSADGTASSGFDQNAYNQNAYNQNNGQYSTNNNGGANYGGSYTTPVRQSQSNSGGTLALTIILLILASPFIVAVFGIIVSILGVVLSIIVALGICAVVFAISGIVAFLTDPALAAILIGTAFICAGLFPLAVYPLCKAVLKGLDSLVKWISGLFRKNKSGKETVQ